LEPIKISVITPCYNVEKYLVECLDSILSQTLKDIELICIDDGSTDATASILESYRERDPRIVIISQENSGPSVGRNAALSIARGEYISFVDSDDSIAGNALEVCYSLACEYGGADMVHFNAETIFESPEFKDSFQDYEEQGQRDLVKNNYIRIGYERFNNKTAPPDGPTLFSEMYPAGAYRPPIWLCIYKHDFIKKHQLRFIEGILHADDPFTFQANLLAKSAVFCEKTLYFRKFRPNSIMTTPFGHKNAVSRIIGQKLMQDFFDGIVRKLPKEARNPAKKYLNYRREVIAFAYLKFLSEDGPDAEYKHILDSLKKYKVPTPDAEAVPLSTRMKNKLKRIIRRIRGNP